MPEAKRLSLSLDNREIVPFSPHTRISLCPDLHFKGGGADLHFKGVDGDDDERGLSQYGGGSRTDATSNNVIAAHQTSPQHTASTSWVL